MKKQNILDLLCDDFIQNHNQEQENKKEIIKTTEDEINLCHHINIFLTNNSKQFNLDFNFNIKSNNKLERAKSLLLLHKCINESINLISITPSFFKQCEKAYNTSRAFDEICFRVLIGNVLIYKKELKKITDKNANSIIESFKQLYDLISTTTYKSF